MLTELTNQNYNELISADKPLVIEFYSPTCVHCKRTEAGLNEAAEELGETAIIAKCDITILYKKECWQCCNVISLRKIWLRCDITLAMIAVSPSSSAASLSPASVLLQ